MYLYLRYSKQGYEIAVVGESENTARYAAINVKSVVIRTMAISGAICGIAGFIAVAGASHTISTSTAGRAAALPRSSSPGCHGSIRLSWSRSPRCWCFLQKGAVEIASQFDLNDFVSDMITGIILFFILGSEFFINYKVRFRGGKKEAGK